MATSVRTPVQSGSGFIVVPTSSNTPCASFAQCAVRAARLQHLDQQISLLIVGRLGLQPDRRTGSACSQTKQAMRETRAAGLPWTRCLRLPQHGSNCIADNCLSATTLEQAMTSISHVAPAAPQRAQAPRQAPVDADGDHDGSKAAKAPAPAQASRPTQTMGNNVDTHA